MNARYASAEPPRAAAAAVLAALATLLVQALTSDVEIPTDEGLPRSGSAWRGAGAGG